MKRLAAVVVVATLAGLTVTACGPDQSTGTCDHAASSKATNSHDFYGFDRPMSEVFAWVSWKAFTNCTSQPMTWTNWKSDCSWWDDYTSANTRLLADTCWHDRYDSYNQSGVTMVTQGQFEGHDGFADRYQLKARVFAAGDGVIYWYCGRSENLNGGGTFGQVNCTFHFDF